MFNQLLILDKQNNIKQTTNITVTVSCNCLSTGLKQMTHNYTNIN